MLVKSTRERIHKARSEEATEAFSIHIHTTQNITKTDKSIEPSHSVYGRIHRNQVLSPLAVNFMPFHIVLAAGKSFDEAFLFWGK